ncbi:molybdate ABC transporter substrate-binding protein [Halobacillus sp. BBL2006]|uniref:molybdate ABC transporter substrate-binding protein n=1 Tax=Halobacillus sp. BBL2006 TaxID=1543706 RepID=UPI000542D826|nr:molybdate ABC transporter substrate-binding protein [Halobacillus sp. BBL2006]KHE68292.1 molybdenum ABC transporter substrate-binding protein [Halobacillus sp. BBL2006]
MIKKTLSLIILVILLTGCAAESEENQTLTISAAASLTDAIQEIAASYEESHNVNIKLNLAGSGKLAQQIEQGAPVDLYLSANQAWMDQLAEKKLVDPDSRTNFATNRIVLVGSKGKKLKGPIQELQTWSENEQLAIGDPESVPAGTYTKQALKTIQVWPKIQNQLVFASDVRQVLAYVESGNVDFGFVYASDAQISDQVSVLTTLDSDWHKPIIYPAAIISDSNQKNHAEKFLSYLKSKPAQKVLHKYGFQEVDDQ